MTPSRTRSAPSLPGLGRLTSPAKIQSFLDGTPYSEDKFYRCPLRVIRERKAHCFDGALFAAAALRRLGHPPLLVDLRAVRDDDHVIAVFRQNGHIGAIAQSNFAGLRFREPIFRNLRELALSYFELYYNVEGEKTLREYSIPLDLTAFDHHGWMTSDTGLEQIATKLDRLRHHRLLGAEMIEGLSRVDDRSFQAGMLGANAAGLYRPESG